MFLLDPRQPDGEVVVVDGEPGQEGAQGEEEAGQGGRRMSGGQGMGQAGHEQPDGQQVQHHVTWTGRKVTTGNKRLQ